MKLAEFGNFNRVLSLCVEPNFLPWDPSVFIPNSFSVVCQNFSKLTFWVGWGTEQWADGKIACFGGSFRRWADSAWRGVRNPGWLSLGPPLL